MTGAAEDRWSDADTARLRDGWGKISASQIGRLLNPKRTASAVTGKAHRLGLPVLEDPITKARRLSTKDKLPPPVPVDAAPKRPTTPWEIWTHWEPGLPETWKYRTHSEPSFAQCSCAAMAGAESRSTQTPVAPDAKTSFHPETA